MIHWKINLRKYAEQVLNEHNFSVRNPKCFVLLKEKVFLFQVMLSQCLQQFHITPIKSKRLHWFLLVITVNLLIEWNEKSVRKNQIIAFCLVLYDLLFDIITLTKRIMMQSIS